MEGDEDEVISSAESTMEETPSEVIEPVEPAEQTSVEPTEPEETLYELPDGRKVDASTLQKEWKENFYPEYTRKSQELAKLTQEKLPNNETVNPYADPSYVPKSYEEIIAVAEARAVEKIKAEERSKVEEYESIENEVASQLTELKKIDPTLNENALFEHANKYDFKDLKLAYKNMKDMSDVVKTTQKTTAHNIAKRNDPVSVASTSIGKSGQKLNPDDFRSAKDYLRALKGGQ